MSQQTPYWSYAAAAVGVVGGAYCAYRLYQRCGAEPLPTRWTRVGTLADISVYPIKSCGAVKLDRAECSILGLKDGWLRDRILMVVDEKYNFITARAYPELLTVRPAVRGAVLTVSAGHLEPLHVDLAEVAALQTPRAASVWGVRVPVRDCGWEASEWFSRLINKTGAEYRLVHYAAQASRALRDKTTNKHFQITQRDTGALPDEVPFNVINEASVRDLNTRLQHVQVSARNFRPNFVVAGPAPYAEDAWRFLRIGDNVFEIIKPCTRCVLTTLDPDTGERSAAPEPLATLQSYRQIEDPEVRRSAGNSPRMGLQMALRSAPGGIVALDDPVYVA